MTQTPPNSWAPGGPPRTGHPTTLPEAWELLDLIGQAVHSLSHSLGLIAADVHAMREAFDRHEATLSAWERGGKVAAWQQMRYARKHGGEQNDHPPRADPGRPNRP